MSIKKTYQYLNIQFASKVYEVCIGCWRSTSSYSNFSLLIERWPRGGRGDDFNQKWVGNRNQGPKPVPGRDFFGLSNLWVCLSNQFIEVSVLLLQIGATIDYFKHYLLQLNKKRPLGGSPVCFVNRCFYVCFTGIIQWAKRSI